MGTAVAVFVTACGGGGGPGPGQNGQVSGNFRATIDGAQWAADVLTIQISGGAVGDVSGPIIITGSQISTGTTMSIALRFVGGPGTYPLGVNATNAGGIATVSRSLGGGATVLSTQLTGAAGTLTITARTNTRIAGTFSYTATVLPGAGTGTAIVTNGSFDLTMNAGLTVPPLPTDSGSVVSATLNGANWNAATIVAPNAAVTFGAGSTDYMLNVLATTVVNGPGTLAIPGQVSVTLIRAGTAQSWTGTGGNGTIVVTGLTTGRLVGTFTMTLAPVVGSGAVGNVVMTNGRFNVRRQ
jgi:hypothetical protein